MSDTNVSAGVFFDTKANKVVDTEPEEGVQIVPPGTVMTPALEADVARYRDLEAGVVREPETITTEKTSARASRVKADKPEGDAKSD